MFKRHHRSELVSLLVILFLFGAGPCYADEEDGLVPLPDFRAEAEQWIADSCYEQYISDRLAEFADDFPKMFEFVGEDRARLFIAMSMVKGRYYNLFAEREISSLYIMMFDLGSEFDSDPLYPWARFPVFPDKDYTEDNPESWQYMQKIWGEFSEFSRESNGEYYQLALRALRRTEKMRFNEVSMLDDDGTVDLLEQLFPERFKLVPVEALRGPIMENAARKAEEYGMPTQTAKNLFTAIFFACGNYADENPLYEPLFEGLKEMSARGLNKERELFKRLKKFLKIVGR